MKIDELYNSLDNIEKGILKHMLLEDKELEDSEELEFYKNGYRTYEMKVKEIIDEIKITNIQKGEINSLLQELRKILYDKKFLSKKSKTRINEIIKRLLFLYNVERNVINKYYRNSEQLDEELFN